jgi:tetratricopeptide (TPR) repeat protein
MKNKDLDNNARGYHAYHWLEYGYLQKGQIEHAEKMVWDMEKYCKEGPSRRARVHLLFLKGTFLAETNLWNHPISNIEIDVSDANISVKSQNYFIDGRIAFENNDSDALDKIIELMESDIKSESLLVDNVTSGFSVCASGNREIPNRTDINESIVMKTQLMALQARLDNNIIETEKLLKESVLLQDQLPYSYGPPFIQKPTKELYAEFLMDQNRFEESIALFKKALEKGTKRLSALNGLEKATLLLEEKALVKEAVL